MDLRLMGGVVGGLNHVVLSALVATCVVSHDGTMEMFVYLPLVTT